jgi:hypothetical protein
LAQPSADGWRVQRSGQTSTVTDGPFVETNESAFSFTTVRVKSRAAQLE